MFDESTKGKFYIAVSERTKRSNSIARTLSIVVVFGTALRAATLYVSPAGSDAAAGRIDSPLATVSAAVARAAPGDTVILRDGVYGPEGRTSGFPVVIRSGGTPSAWITLRAERRGGAVLDCGNSGAVRTGCDGYIYLGSGAAYWVFEDLVFQRGYSCGVNANSNPGAHHILVRGCRFENIGRHSSDSPYGEIGFYASEDSSNLTFDGNVFHDIGRTAGSHNSLDHGLYLHSANTAIINNVFYGPIAGWGIQTARGFSGVIANNTFAFPMSPRGGQLMLWDLNPAVTVRNNIFYRPGGGVAIRSSSLSTAGCTIDHNLFSGGAPGVVSECAWTANLSGDPSFVNATSPPYDFRLLPGSAAATAGVAISGLTTDHDGNIRPQAAGQSLGAFRAPQTGDPPGRSPGPPQRPAEADEPRRGGRGANRFDRRKVD